MNGQVHKLIAVSTSLSVAAVYFPTLVVFGVATFPIVGVPFSIVGGILADADINGSEMGHKYPLIAKITTHRGITHTPEALAIVSSPLFLLSQTPNVISTQILMSVCLGFALGYLSHIVFADWWNGKGVPLIWPLTSKRMHICRVVTGTYQEFVYGGLWALLMLFNIICHYRGMII